MKVFTTISAIRQINWHTIYRRGFAAAALTIFLGPPLGGLTFGILGDVNHIIHAVRGQLPDIHTNFWKELYSRLPLAGGDGSGCFIGAQRLVFSFDRCAIRGRSRWNDGRNDLDRDHFSRGHLLGGYRLDLPNGFLVSEFRRCA
jgi:hypothetical protein